MPINGLRIICEKLIEYGMSAATPAALVENGTRPGQRVLTGTLATLPASVAQANVGAPTLLIVGTVVALRERLAWFEATQAEAGKAT